VSGVDPAALRREILERLHGAGFALVGVAPAMPVDRPDAFRAWLHAGHHGEMAYLQEHLAQRLDPGVMVPGARAVICVADRYADGRPDTRPPHGSGWGRIARYARGADYHRVIRDRLEPLAVELRGRFPGERFRVCVDTAPLAERDHAVRAGLGRIGKHTLLIGRGGLGSWLVLGAMVTTVPLEPDAPQGGDPCGSCTRCIDACPTGAIEPWKVKADRCISYLTIEHQGEPAEWFRRRVDDWLFGCDACIEACPHSQWTLRSRRLPIRPEYAPRVSGFALHEVASWTPDQWRRHAHSEVLQRMPLEGWRRNARLIGSTESAAD
jgi:epoxyqueuosine reductase